MEHAPELIIPLDVPGAAEAAALVDRLTPPVTFFKVGLELFTREGPAAVRRLTDRGLRVFLDLKLHDIPRTVERTVHALAELDVSLATVHAAGGEAMLRAAADAAPDGLSLLAVTTLTSLGPDDLAAAGIARTPSEQAVALGRLAVGAGIEGLVTSVHELPALRAALGDDPLLVTPGIRPAGAAVGDQKRVATPAEAVAAGATHLVVGRPITGADDPAAAAAAILADMRAGGRHPA